MPEEKASLSLPIAFDVFADDVDEFLEGTEYCFEQRFFSLAAI